MFLHILPYFFHNLTDKIYYKCILCLKTKEFFFSLEAPSKEEEEEYEIK